MKMNIKIEAIDKDTVDFDGERFYRCPYCDYSPYVLFDTVKIRFYHLQDWSQEIEFETITWNEKFKIVDINISVFNGEHNDITKNYNQQNSVFFTTEYAGFVKRLERKFCGSLSSITDPGFTVDARKVRPGGKLPKIIKTNHCYYYFDLGLYNQQYDG